MNPSNRSPLITGGASGINLAMSRCFRDLGLEPICSRAQTRLQRSWVLEQPTGIKNDDSFVDAA